MPKIGKYIRSALNNSNTNEAAQALKLAAIAMQKEGVNPASLLQERDAQSACDSELSRANRFLEHQIRDLKARLARALDDGVDAAELREAKGLAIKWHKLAQLREQELKHLTSVAAAAQTNVSNLEIRLSNVKSRLLIFCAVASLAVGSIFYQLAYNTGMTNGREQANSEKYNSEIRKVGSSPKMIAPGKTVKSAPVINSEIKATCYIQKKIPRQGQTTLHNVRFWFNNGIVTPVVDGKASKEEASKGRLTRSEFLTDINQRWPGVANCRLGVNE